jgi:hypothetical protein
MKREWPQYRRPASHEPFVRPSAVDQPGAVRLRPGQRRKIFIVKETIRLRGTLKKAQRILIFDNHPDSLRLVSGDRDSREVDLSESGQFSAWERIIVSMAALVALASAIGLLWPLL